MDRKILYYFAWQEDVWLDEFLDRFQEVIALVPTGKSLQEIEDATTSSKVVVVNVEVQPEETEQFLTALIKSSLYDEIPIFFVGLESEQKKEEWLSRYPKAKGIVVEEHTYDYNYEPILSQIEAEWEK